MARAAQSAMRGKRGIRWSIRGDGRSHTAHPASVVGSCTAHTSGMAMWAEHLPVVGSLHLAGPIGSCLAVARRVALALNLDQSVLCAR